MIWKTRATSVMSRAVVAILTISAPAACILATRLPISSVDGVLWKLWEETMTLNFSGFFPKIELVNSSATCNICECWTLERVTFICVCISEQRKSININSSSSLFDFSNPYSFIYSKLMALDADSWRDPWLPLYIHCRVFQQTSSQIDKTAPMTINSVRAFLSSMKGVKPFMVNRSFKY